MRLDIEDLSFAYGQGGPVIEGLSLRYESPAALCILGANGAGKSTLLQCLVGALKPRGGSVRIDGRPVASYAARELARLVAYLPQAHQPAFEYPVLDVVAMGRTSLMGRFAAPSETDRSRALEKLDFLGVAHLRDKPYTKISGGERQLVMLAAALAQEPKVLVLDEPTAHLDFGRQYRFVKLVAGLCAQGMGVIMTTHVPDQALELGGTTAIMDEGRLARAGRAREVVSPRNLAALYGIEVNVERVKSRLVCIPGPLEA